MPRSNSEMTRRRAAETRGPGLCAASAALLVALAATATACARSDFGAMVAPWQGTCGPTATTGTWTLVQTLAAGEWPDIVPAPGSAFGYRLHLLPSLIAVGAPEHDGGGKVFLYGRERNSDALVPVQRVGASDGETGDGFGFPVLSPAGLLAVGAPDDEGGTSIESGGSVYLFGRDGPDSPFRQLDALIAFGAHSGGFHLAFDGEELIVGRGGADLVTGLDTSGGALQERWSYSHPPSARFGWAVAVAGDTLAVSDDWYPPDGGDSGLVVTYNRDSAGGFSEQEVLGEADADLPTNVFGHSLVLSDGRLFVGSPGDFLGTYDVGTVYVFVRQAGHWQREAALRIPLEEYDGWNGFNHGNAVAAAGTTLLAGAPRCRRPDGEQGGCVSVYRRQGSDWTRVDKLYPPGPPADEGFGEAVSVCGDRLAIGAPGSDRVYLYELR